MHDLIKSKDFKCLFYLDCDFAGFLFWHFTSAVFLNVGLEIRVLAIFEYQV